MLRSFRGSRRQVRALEQDPVYHYPPDFLELLVDTIGRLNRGREGVLVFFRSAGVPSHLLDDLAANLERDKNSHRKFPLVRTVLVRLNEAGDACLAARREVVRRVVEFEDYSRCWATDVLEAKGLVAEVRRLVNVKDSFTRMSIERERAQKQARAMREVEVEAKRKRQEAIDEVKRELFPLFGESNAHRRGKALEGVLNRLFAAFGILVREAFTVKASDGPGVMEQIDGAIELDAHPFLVEMRWWKEPLGPGDTAQHLVRVFSRDGVRGLFISATDYTPAAVQQYREALRDRIVILCTLEEIVGVLNDGEDLGDFLRNKVRAAAFDRNPFLKRGSAR